MQDSKDAAARERIESVEELEDLLSEPTPAAVEALGALEGDVIVLGAGGKMGPTLARMARRALDTAGAAGAAGERRRVIAVSRFSSAEVEARLRGHGVETIRCDLHDEDALSALPDAPNVVYMVGTKFGSTGNEAAMWATNCYLPGRVARRYSRSRIVAFSSGSVYSLVPVDSGGSVETDAPGPVGEYAMSCLGRERMLEHASRELGTRVALIRLNYAAELRYGVLVDLAGKVLAGEPVELAMGHFNTIWQGDANAAALAAFARASSPPFVLNVTGDETLGVRAACEELGRLMKRPVELAGEESPDAFLSSPALARRLFGPPRVSAERLVRWVADWVARGGERSGKPTHFEVRDGKF